MRGTHLVLALFYRPANLRRGGVHHHRADGRRRRLDAADRAVPPDHAAEHHRFHHLPRRRRPDRGRVRGRPHRAAGQRRREHVVHVLAGGQRRLLQPQRHLQAGRQPEFRPGSGAKPRQPRPAATARRGPPNRRHHAQAQPRHPPGRQSLRPGQPLQPALPQQLRLHLHRRRDEAHRRRRRRVPVRRAGLRHAASGWTPTSWRPAV